MARLTWDGGPAPDADPLGLRMSLETAIRERLASYGVVDRHGALNMRIAPGDNLAFEAALRALVSEIERNLAGAPSHGELEAVEQIRRLETPAPKKAAQPPAAGRDKPVTEAKSQVLEALARLASRGLTENSPDIGKHVAKETGLHLRRVQRILKSERDARTPKAAQRSKTTGGKLRSSRRKP